jgi:cytochrome c oxidase assembly protein subunit 11
MSILARTLLVSGKRCPILYAQNCQRVRNNLTFRHFSNGRKEQLDDRNNRLLLYALSLAVGTLGVSYASVPLYKMFCQATGYGGTTQEVDMETARKMKPVEGANQIKVTFNADTTDTLPWKFRPVQREVRVVPGETALAFYRAHNPTDKAITGVATYNVTPMKAGVYFNKIQVLKCVILQLTLTIFKVLLF